MAMNVGAQGYGSVGYGMAAIPVVLPSRLDVGRVGMGNQPYGWGGFGAAPISPAVASSGDSSQLIRWRRRGRR
jgi:hypothetical protein